MPAGGQGVKQRAPPSATATAPPALPQQRRKQGVEPQATRR